MKNLTKKLIVMLVAVFMLLSGVHTKTVDAAINRAKDEDMMVITGLTVGDTLELYKIYSATYSSDGTTVDSYQFTNKSKIVDGGKEVVIVPEQKYTQAEFDEYYATNGFEPTWAVDDVKVTEVKVRIADLPTDEDGTILVKDADGVTVDSTTYDATNTNVDLTAAKALNGKYPFTISGKGSNVGPTESQVLAISSAIAAGNLSVPKADIYKNATEKETDNKVTATGNKIEILMNAKANPDVENDTDFPAIYDATGIYIGRITPAPGTDTIYNPIVVSAGYKNENNDSVFDSTPLNVSTATYHYAGSKGTAKKSTPTVNKTVTGGFLETGNKPIVACDLDGHPYGYTYEAVQLPGNALTYIKAPYTQVELTAALNGEKFSINGTRWEQNDSGTVLTKEQIQQIFLTTNVEEAQTESKTDNIRSGALGSLFTYKITPTIPDYPENAVNKTLWFADRMGQGLDYVEGSLLVNLGASTKVAPTAFDRAVHTEVPSDVTPDYVYLHENKVVAYAKEANNGFTINFIYDNIPTDVVAKSGTTRTGLVLEYQAVLNDEAFIGLPGNPNVATMIYSNNPDKGSTHEKLTKPSGNGNREVEDEEIVYTYNIKFRKVDENGQPLNGAVFGLYAQTNIVDSDGNQLYAANDLVCTIETKEGGLGSAILEAPGTYYLKEIKAPANYQLNNNEYRDIVVKWTTAKKKFSSTRETWEYTTTKPTQTKPYDYTKQVGWLVGPTPSSTPVTNGTTGEFYQLADYPLGDWTYNSTNHTLTHTSGQVIKNVWEAYIDPGTHVKTTLVDQTETVTREDDTGLGWIEYTPDIPNTKTPSLPSTGGIGTYLFTIAGVAIIATAAFMLIFRKKEGHNH